MCIDGKWGDRAFLIGGGIVCDQRAAVRTESLVAPSRNARALSAGSPSACRKTIRAGKRTIPIVPCELCRDQVAIVLWRDSGKEMQQA